MASFLKKKLSENDSWKNDEETLRSGNTVDMSSLKMQTGIMWHYEVLKIIQNKNVLLIPDLPLF